jgi:hypothetical protein
LFINLKTLIHPSSNLQTEEARQEFATRALSAIIGIGLLALTLSILVLNVLTDMPVAPFIPLMLVLLVMHTIAWLFIKNGYWKTARYIPPIIFLFTGTALTANPDLNSIAILSYILGTLLTAVLFNTRMQWGMIVLCSLTYLGAPFLFNISLSNAETNIRYVHVIIFGVVGVIQQVTAAIISQTINQLMLETESRKRSEESALQKEGILSAIGQSAQLLLDAQDWESKIEDILRLLGTVSGASHAYLFQNHQDENAALVTSLKYQWNNPSQCESSDLHAFQNIPCSKRK